MRIEPFLFPAVIVAAVASIYVAFRRTPGATVTIPAAPAAPISFDLLPANLSPVAAAGAPYAYLPATRYNPPPSLYGNAPAGASTLRVPADLTAAQAVGVAQSGNLAGQGTGCGCCGS